MALKVKKRFVKRELAVIESPPGVSTTYTSQLVMMTPQEMEQCRKAFPYLNVRRATDEDKKQWQFSESLFDDNGSELPAGGSFKELSPR